jgi:hypothetical protein
MSRSEVRTLGTAPQRVGWYLKYAPLLTVTFVGLFAQFNYLPNHDTSWLLEVARRLAHGATLYSADIVEINPPLIFQLTSVAYHLGRWTGVDPLTSWRLLVALQIALSLWLSARWLRSILAVGAADLRYPLLALLAWIFVCLPGYDYGQREHFIVLWLTPYLVAAAGRCTGAPAPTWLRATTGLLPALVLCLKPHYALSILAAEAIVATSRRSLWAVLDAGAFSCVAALITYGLTVLWWFPGYLALAVPLGLRYYPAFGELRLSPAHGLYWLAAIAALAVTRAPRIAVVQARVFVGAAVGAFAAFLAQRKGWSYHFLPTKTFLLLAVAVAVAVWGRTLVTRLVGSHGDVLRRRAAVLGTIGLTLAATGKTWSDVHQFASSRPARESRDLAAYVDTLRREDGTTTLAALSYSLGPAFPVTEIVHGEWGMRFSCLWILPGIVAEEAAGQADAAAYAGFGRRYLQRAIDEDFARWRPDVVLVDERRQPSPLPELLKGERFRETWRGYREIGQLHQVRVFVATHMGPRLAGAR